MPPMETRMRVSACGKALDVGCNVYGQPAANSAELRAGAQRAGSRHYLIFRPSEDDSTS